MERVSRLSGSKSNDLRAVTPEQLDPALLAPAATANRPLLGHPERARLHDEPHRTLCVSSSTRAAPTPSFSKTTSTFPPPPLPPRGRADHAGDRYAGGSNGRDLVEIGTPVGPPSTAIHSTTLLFSYSSGARRDTSSGPLPRHVSGGNGFPLDHPVDDRSSIRPAHVSRSPRNPQGVPALCSTSTELSTPPSPGLSPGAHRNRSPEAPTFKWEVQEDSRISFHRNITSNSRSVPRQLFPSGVRRTVVPFQSH